LKTSTRQVFHELNERIRKQYRHYIPHIIVCGAGKLCQEDCAVCPTGKRQPCYYNQRMRLVDAFNQNDFNAVTFEEHFELRSPSVEEIKVCRYEEVDKVVVFSHSPAAISEYSSFMEDPVVRRKLVILVPMEHHPYINPRPGYIDSAFWRIMVDGGQVLPYDASGVRPAWDCVKKYFETYKAVKSHEATL